MTDLKKVGQQLAEILKKQNADYIEAHLEESQFSSISYRGKQLESHQQKPPRSGGNVRALVKGGWGFVSFNDLTGLQDKVEMAVKQARLSARKPAGFMRPNPVVEDVPVKIKENPALIPAF